MPRIAVSFSLAVISLLTSYAIADTWPDSTGTAGPNVAQPAATPGKLSKMLTAVTPAGSAVAGVAN